MLYKFQSPLNLSSKKWPPSDNPLTWIFWAVEVQHNTFVSAIACFAFSFDVVTLTRMSNCACTYDIAGGLKINGTVAFQTTIRPILGYTAVRISLLSL